MTESHLEIEWWLIDDPEPERARVSGVVRSRRTGETFLSFNAPAGNELERERSFQYLCDELRTRLLGAPPKKRTTLL